MKTVYVKNSDPGGGTKIRPVAVVVLLIPASEFCPQRDLGTGTRCSDDPSASTFLRLDQLLQAGSS